MEEPKKKKEGQKRNLEDDGNMVMEHKKEKNKYKNKKNKKNQNNKKNKKNKRNKKIGKN